MGPKLKAIPNPLVEAFRNERHVWAGRLTDVLEDFEIRLQLLESEPGGPGAKGSGKVTPAFKTGPAKKRASVPGHGRVRR